jgi:hypothetical protein
VGVTEHRDEHARRLDDPRDHHDAHGRASAYDGATVDRRPTVPDEQLITLSDEDIVTRPVGHATASTVDDADTGDDTGDVSDTSDTGDDSGDTGDDSGDTSDTSDTGDDSAAA